MSINAKPKDLKEFHSEIQWQLVNLKRIIESFIFDTEARLMEYEARAKSEIEVKACEECGTKDGHQPECTKLEEDINNEQQ